MSLISVQSAGEWQGILSGTNVVIADCKCLQSFPRASDPADKPS